MTSTQIAKGGAGERDVKGAERRAGADTTSIQGRCRSVLKPPRGTRARELLDFIRSEIDRTGAFPSAWAKVEKMGWKSQASLDDTLLRLMDGGFIVREVVGRHGMRRRFTYTICGGPDDRREVAR